MRGAKAAHRVNSSNGVAVSKAAQERVCVAPRGRTAPRQRGEPACLGTGLASLCPSASFLLSSFSSDHSGVGPSLEELKRWLELLRISFGHPPELHRYSPGCSPPSPPSSARGSKYETFPCNAGLFFALFALFQVPQHSLQVYMQFYILFLMYVYIHLYICTQYIIAYIILHTKMLCYICTHIHAYP